MEERRYKITGMFCSMCQKHVGDAVNKLDCVANAEVSLIENSMTVTFNDKIDDKKVIKAVKDAGYGASVIEDDSFKARRIRRNRDLKKALIKLVVSIALVLALMYFSMGSMIGLPEPSIKIINYALQFALATSVIVLYWNLISSGWKTLFKGKPTMLTLVAVGSSISFIYSLVMLAFYIVSISKGSADLTTDIKEVLSSSYSIEGSSLYFEAAAMIPTLISVGKFLEAIAKSKTTSSIENLLSLAPETAILIEDGEEKEIPTDKLKAGDICLIKPGSRIPADGIIVSGYGNIEESAVTGESLPVYKSEDDKVIGSTLNVTGSFKMRVTTIGEDTVVSKIVKLVEEASSSKAKLAGIADKASAYFVPFVMSAALIVFLVWGFVSSNWTLAMNYGISTLVVACPCALGLATPVAVMVGAGKGAQNGILIKSASAFEDLSRVKTIVFDKTGTITNGHFEIVFSSVNDKEALNALLSLESLSEHPLAGALCLHFESNGAVKKEVDCFESIPGKGVKGMVDGVQSIAGTLEFLKANKIEVIEENNLNFAGSYIYFAYKNEYLGCFILADQIKEGSKEEVQKLFSKGIDVVLATGDNEESANAIASTVQIETVYSKVKPEDKLNIVNEIKTKGNIIAMVGDGINDAPALESADVGIAIGSGTDIAIDSADIVLVNSSLQSLNHAITLSKKVVNNIKLNLFWAFFYNIILMPIAAGALSPLGIVFNPMFSSAAMALSSICVVLNALRLKLVKFEK